jgi:hypothetical protein
MRTGTHWSSQSALYYIASQLPQTLAPFHTNGGTFTRIKSISPKCRRLIWGWIEISSQAEFLQSHLLLWSASIKREESKEYFSAKRSAFRNFQFVRSFQKNKSTTNNDAQVRWFRQSLNHSFNINLTSIIWIEHVEQVHNNLKTIIALPIQLSQICPTDTDLSFSNLLHWRHSPLSMLKYIWRYVDETERVLCSAEKVMNCVNSVCFATRAW